MWFADDDQLSSTVLGITLGPLTVGQLVTLHQIGCIFLPGGVKINGGAESLDHIAHCTLAAKLSPVRFEAYLTSRLCKYRLAFWSSRLTQSQFEGAGTSLANHIESNLDFRGIRNVQGGTEIQTPLAMRMIHFLTTRFSLADTMEMRTFEACKLMLADLELSGSVKMLDEGQRELLSKGPVPKDRLKGFRRKCL